MTGSEERFCALPGWCGFEDEQGRVVITNDRDTVLDLATRHEPFAVYRLARAGRDSWFWCVEHQQAEQWDGTDGHTHVGPYFTEAEAVEWGTAVRRIIAAYRDG
jgi:hypothetical protein